MAIGAGRGCKSQSSLELLITLSFGLIILLPIVVLAFIQISASTSTLSTTEAQQVASKLASVASVVGSQGSPAKEVVSIQIPPDVQAIMVGTPSGGVGHEIIFNVSTNAGVSFITAYTSVNVSGNLANIEATATYLINVSAQDACPSDAAVPCVYIQEE
ncbi:MAG: hypothetical protein M1603_02785 [Candidatus Marsarchaeota archaeon]|jgi:hypothetical protein|nr:hypothetical protein [Candidatus Marsarchaeota archaeon]